MQIDADRQKTRPAVFVAIDEKTCTECGVEIFRGGFFLPRSRIGCSIKSATVTKPGTQVHDRVQHVLEKWREVQTAGERV